MLKKKDHCLTCLEGKTRYKSDKIFVFFGDLDELLATIGLARAFSRKKSLKQTLLSLQDDLVALGGVIAGAIKAHLLRQKTKSLEKKIDQLKDPNVKEFSRPGATKVSAFLHLARATARRLERRALKLKPKPHSALCAYLNRLSLLLFWLAKKEEQR